MVKLLSLLISEMAHSVYPKAWKQPEQCDQQSHITGQPRDDPGIKTINSSKSWQAWQVGSFRLFQFCPLHAKKYFNFQKSWIKSVTFRSGEASRIVIGNLALVQSQVNYRKGWLLLQWKNYRKGRFLQIIEIQKGKISAMKNQVKMHLTSLQKFCYIGSDPLLGT